MDRKILLIEQLPDDTAECHKFPANAPEEERHGRNIRQTLTRRLWQDFFTTGNQYPALKPDRG